MLVHQRVDFPIGSICCWRVPGPHRPSIVSSVFHGPKSRIAANYTLTMANEMCRKCAVGTGHNVAMQELFRFVLPETR